MTESKYTGGVVHDLPDALEQKLIEDSRLEKIWGSLTPLARNE